MSAKLMNEVRARQYNGEGVGSGVDEGGGGEDDTPNFGLVR